MNCESFQTMIRDLAREQNGAAQLELVDASEQTKALEHAVACDACGLIWEEERSLTGSLRNLALDMNSLAAPPQLEAKVLAAFRERSNGKGVVTPFKPRGAQSQAARYWLAAIAALLLIVFGMVAVRSGILTRSKPENAKSVAPQKKEPLNVQPPDIKGASTGPTQDLAQTPPRDKDNYATISHQHKGVRGRYQARVVSASLGLPRIDEANNEITTDFFPISYGSAPNLQEGGQLMRVELPRSAMARFGLPVNMERASETVKADVLIGSDGLAQAIRFVH